MRPALLHYLLIIVFLSLLTGLDLERSTYISSWTPLLGKDKIALAKYTHTTPHEVL